MKYNKLLIPIILMVLCLSACDPSDFYYNYDELKELAVEIQLINYNNPKAEEINEFLVEKREEMKPFHFDKMEVAEVLSETEIDDFLKEISEIEFLMSWVHADSPNGRCIRIIYENGDFEIIGDHYVGSFDSEGNVKRFIGLPNQRLENLIDEYLYA